MHFIYRIRSVIGSVLFVITTLILSIAMIIVGYLRIKTVQDWIARIWGNLFCLYYGIRYTLEGTENFPKGRGFLVLFNHLSHADIPLLFGSIPISFRFGAKIELFKIPFFGPAMRACGVLPIARGDRKKVFQVYKEAEAKFKKGYSYGLAPEGTRQEKAEIGPFKKGPFIFAANAKAPLVPVVIKGTHQIMKKHSLMVNGNAFRSHVKLKVLPPTYTDDWPDVVENKDFLEEQIAVIRSQFIRAYNEM